MSVSFILEGNDLLIPPETEILNQLFWIEFNFAVLVPHQGDVSAAKMSCETTAVCVNSKSNTPYTRNFAKGRSLGNAM